MCRLSLTKKLTLGMKRSLPASLLAATFFAASLAGISIHPSQTLAQSNDTRVLWNLNYDNALSTAQRNEVESSVIKTLVRASERHFVGNAIIAQKLKKEGFNFPECFTQAESCALGGNFVLDVYNVDAYASAVFSKDGNDWVIDLTLYRRLSSAPTKILRKDAKLDDLLQSVLGSFFDMESEMEILCEQPDVEIYVDKQLVGIAPLTMRIPAGEHDVVFKKPGYVSQNWSFNAVKGNLYSQKAELVPEVTQLSVLTSAPDAQIVIDGENWGAVNAPNDILPGDHHVEITAPGYHPFEQDYKVYPGNPQTMQVALLPQSDDPYTVRHNGILKYRLSATAGYHYMHQPMSMLKSQTSLAGLTGKYQPKNKEWASADFHGASFAFNYEAEYWGLTFLRFDIAGSSFESKDNLALGGLAMEGVAAHPDNALLLALYPAQLKAHYTFWVMQAEAVFGVGFAWKKVNGTTYYGDFSLSDSAFSLNFNLALKYFMSEESFITFSYDLQYDAKNKEVPRHGLTLGLGIQIPVWMRTNSPSDSEPEETEIDESDSDYSESENAENTQPEE